MNDIVTDIWLAISYLVFSDWILAIYTSFLVVTSESRNIFDGRLSSGLTLVLRLTGKVSKDIKFNFKKEMYELFLGLKSFSLLIVLILAWYNLFGWFLLFIVISLVGISKSLENISYRDPFYTITKTIFDKLRYKDRLFKLYDLLAIMFIIYFIRVLYF